LSPLLFGQATYNIIKEQSLSPLSKSFLPPLYRFICGMVTYICNIRRKTALMSDNGGCAITVVCN
jgi:NAD(P)H-quinone oxidoreductase subunit 5